MTMTMYENKTLPPVYEQEDYSDHAVTWERGCRKYERKCPPLAQIYLYPHSFYLTYSLPDLYAFPPAWLLPGVWALMLFHSHL